MSLEFKLKRLEEIMVNVCETIIDHNLDYSWQKWADPLKLFIKQIESERIEENE